jgi:hypothetical protein
MDEIEECINPDWDYEDCPGCEAGTVCELPKRKKYEFELGLSLMNPNDEPDEDFFETD